MLWKVIPSLFLFEAQGYNAATMNETIALFGASGMLGQSLHHHFLKQGISVVPFNSKNCDIRSESSVYDVLRARPDLTAVINAAAYTKVDDCETHQELAFALNAEGPMHIAKACADLRLPLVHFSTDYVFDGEKHMPYIESDPTHPLSIYGLSKLTGELNVLNYCPNSYICRIQWLYGPTGTHFIKTIINLGRTKTTLSVVSDQLGAPTSTQAVSEWVFDLLRLRPTPGIYHMTAAGETNWCEYTRFIFDAMGINCKVYATSSESYPRPAKRPKNGRLSIAKLQDLDIRPRHWKDDVRQYLRTLLD